MIYQSRTISVQIDREPAEVYGFVSELENLPRWAATFCKSIRKADGNWVIETPQGAMSIRIAPKNTLGVLDHYVAPASGNELYVPMRVVANGSGSEVLFTIFRLPDTSAESFAEDAALAGKDLESLKELMERRPPSS